MTTNSFELHRPWRPYLYRDREVPVQCPRCKGELQRERLPYVVATMTDSRICDPLLIGGLETGFCTACAIAVVDETAVVERLLVASIPDWDVGEEYVILGVVDVDAIPEAEADTPPGSLDPLPLVHFAEPRVDKSKRRTRRRKRRR